MRGHSRNNGLRKLNQEIFVIYGSIRSSSISNGSNFQVVDFVIVCFLEFFYDRVKVSCKNRRCERA